MALEAPLMEPRDARVDPTSCWLSAAHGARLRVYVAPADPRRHGRVSEVNPVIRDEGTDVHNMLWPVTKVRKPGRARDGAQSPKTTPMRAGVAFAVTGSGDPRAARTLAGLVRWSGTNPRVPFPPWSPQPGQCCRGHFAKTPSDVFQKVTFW